MKLSFKVSLIFEGRSFFYFQLVGYTTFLEMLNAMNIYIRIQKVLYAFNKIFATVDLQSISHLTQKDRGN